MRSTTRTDARSNGTQVVSVHTLTPEATRLAAYFFPAKNRGSDGTYRFIVAGPVRSSHLLAKDGTALLRVTSRMYTGAPTQEPSDGRRLMVYCVALATVVSAIRGLTDGAALEQSLLDLALSPDEVAEMLSIVEQSIRQQPAASTVEPTARGEPAAATTPMQPSPSVETPQLIVPTQPAAPANEVPRPDTETPHDATSQHRGGEPHSGTMSARSASQAGTITFPESGYVGVAAKFAQLFAEKYESPKEFLYLDCLTLIGTVMSGRVRADFDLPVQPRLYVIKVAKSAWRRKSTSTRLADQFVQAALQRVGESKLRSRDWPQVIYGAGSAEGVGVELMPKEEEESGLEWSQTTRRAVLVFDELRRFEAKAAIKGSALRPMVNELFEANRYHNLTLSCPIRIEDGHLAFLSNATEETYRNLLEAVEFRDIGFLNRLFIVTGNSDKRFARPKAPAESLLWPIREELAQYISELPPLNEDGSASEEVVIPLTPEADAAWTEWYAALPETEQTARLDNLGMRLMGLLAFSSGRKQIDLELLRSVLDILQYQQQVRAVYRPIEAENPAAKVEQKIVLALQQHGGLSRRQLHRRIHAERCGVQLFNTALTNLIREGRVKPTQGVLRLADEGAEEEP